MKRLVEFCHGDAHEVGVVTGQIGEKLEVVGLGGTTFRVRSGEITAELGEADEEHILEVVSGAAAVVPDIAQLWEVVAEQPRGYDLSELTKWTAGDTPALRLALARALRAAPHFKLREGLYFPRDAQAVAHMQVSRDVAGERVAARARFVTSVVEILSRDSAARRDALVDLTRDAVQRGFLDVLRTYALNAEADAVDAATLLDDIEGQLGRALSYSGSLKAFDLLVELGHWTVHENLEAQRLGLAREFDAALEEEARAIAARPWIPERWREDFTGWWSVTIDDASTRDIDDGFSVRPTMEGGWELAIHIADPSAYIEPNSALDIAARRRGTTVYLAEGAAPMFPRVLSEDKMSLVEGQQRAALTTHVVFDEALNIESWRIVPSVVSMNRRLSYDEADALLADEDSRAHVAEILGTLKWLAEERFLERSGRGAVQIELPEPRVKANVGPHDVEVDVRVRPESPSVQLVMELMVLCNALAGDFLWENNVPGMFRGQEPPDEPLDSRDVETVPAGPARQFALLKRMKRGEVRTTPCPHFALGLQRYVQTSSPIRRYGDLVMQRQITAHFLGQRVIEEAEMAVILADCERAVQEAQRIERESLDYWTTWKLGVELPVLDATVIDVESGRALLLLRQTGTRAYIKTREVLRLGAEVRVQVVHADARLGQLQLQML
ncbi:MAG: RNB domain-containing ribonuclease [bacterium]